MTPFQPPRRMGILFHFGALIILIASAVFGLTRAAQASIGPIFLASLLPSFLALILAPILAYRLYALYNAKYVLERDAIHLQWGLRLEVIPMAAIQWVRLARELTNRVPLPWIYWPGSVIGVRHYGKDRQVEYLSASTRNIVLIGTPDRIFAISPANSTAFISAFNRLSELGSLTPIQPQSVQPRLLLTRVWATRPARWLIITGFLLSLALLTWVSLVIPGLSETYLGFFSTGLPRGPIPPVQLLLLPILTSIIYLFDLLLGLVFFRQDANHPLAYLLWGSGVVIPLVFLLSVFLILRVG
jgi:hypothetical protein